MSMISDPKTYCRGRVRQLDYAKAFAYWTECGTVKKAISAMEADGLVKEDGKSFHPKTVIRGAWLWVFENSDEAMKLWQEKGFLPNGKDDVWRDFICRKIRRMIEFDTPAFGRYLKAADVEDFYLEKYGRDYK